MSFSRTLLATAAFLTLGGAAQAADQLIDLSSGQASFKSTAPILAGGDDVLTFFGLAPGVYDFVFSISSQFNAGFSGTVNGSPFATAVLGPITAGALVGVSSAPFSVTLFGTPTSGFATYSGELTATLVPEPGTWAMFAAGLGVLGTLAARRRV
jgi:hypothetical protein